MQRPERLWQQYEGKAFAELSRGMGTWPLQDHACDLEPPWEPFDRRALTVWDCVVNGWEAPWEGSWLKRLVPGTSVHDPDEPVLLPEVAYDTAHYKDLVAIVIEQFSDDEATIPKAEQLLLSLPALSRPVSFELIGIGPQPEFDQKKAAAIFEANGKKGKMEDAICGWTDPYSTVQFVAHRSDARQVGRLLLAHYPNSAVTLEEILSDDRTDRPSTELNWGDGYAATLALDQLYCWPLRTFSRLDPDPLGVAIAAMDHLGRDEWAMIQVLFQPTFAPWADTLREAIQDPYKPGQFLFDDLSDAVLATKFSSPLFAVVVRIAAKAKGVWRQLLGWAEQFAAPPQRLDVLDDDEQGSFSWSLRARCTYRPGMLLNAQELASLVHLPAPSVVSERLQRVKARTRPAVAAADEQESVALGINLHRGQRKVARIPPKLRPRHCYVAGASGTGKSTLLMNLILQDITAGRGVGVLDPHGDLVHAVLRRIPENRIKDVVFFDPADQEYPFALNILEAKDASERERIVAETVMALERYFPASWGPRLERILTYTIYTVLDAIPGATLADVERMLTDESFQQDVISKTRDARFLQFWNKQFRFFPKNAVDPVLNKLSPFLLNRTVRNIICQRRSAIDFDSLLNDGKILLANLSTGLLTEKIAGMFGSFLVTKIVNAAFRRARILEDQRRGWYLYVDEFQAFMNLSVGFDRILAEARKYKLVLAGLANQYVGQLTPEVRQAIFGNVGTFVVFRLGVEDAQIVARELGPFTAEEILNLELGQAIARAGGSATSFNLETYPEPPVPETDPSKRIIALTRKHYSRSRPVVERELADAEHPTQKRRKRPRKRQDDEPSDPSEDDLIS